MRRFTHLLKKNKRTSPQTDWIFFDTESRIEKISDTQQKHVFILGWGFYVRLKPDYSIERRKECFFTSSEQFCDFIETCIHGKSVLHVLAHNIGYDLQITNLIPILHKRGWDMIDPYAKNLTFIVRMRKGKSKIVFEDGLNRLRGKIEDWGKRLNLSKIVVDFENATEEQLKERCYRDTLILQEATLAYLRFVKDENLGAVRSTISSQAFAAFQHRFMKHDIEIHCNPVALRLEREAYGGGMTRIFKRGKFTGDVFYLLDVNSMYGYVMREFEYPCRLRCVLDNCTIEHLSWLLERRCVIAKCTVKPSTPAFRCKHLKRITYPTAKFTGVFTTEELKWLLRENAILEIHQVATYLKAPLFVEYVDFFWKKREEAIKKDDAINKELCKQFLNSLYGKWGAYAGGFRRYKDFDSLPTNTTQVVFGETGEKRSVFFFFGQCYMESKGEEGFNSFPAIAAEITANARLVLWKLIELAGYENTYYTDTDSLIVNSEGYLRLQKMIGKELGLLKKQEESTEVIIHARKDYTIGKRIVCKGVKISYLLENPSEHKRDEWRKFLTYIRQGCPETFITRTQPLNLKRRTYDGIVLPSGDVKPFTTLPQSWT